MEEKDEPNEQNRINLEENINSKTILSALFNEYQKLEKNPNNEVINNKKNKNTINDLKIKNNDDFSKVINSKLEEIKNTTLSRLNSAIDRYKTCYDQYQNGISKFIEKEGNNLSKITNNNFKNSIILEYVVSNIINKINNIFEIYDNILDNIGENLALLNDILGKINLFNQKMTIEEFLNNYYKNILNCSLINKFDFKRIDNSHIIPNNYYINYYNFLKAETNNKIIKTFRLKNQKNDKDKKKEEDIKKEEVEKMNFFRKIFPSIENLELNGINRDFLELIINTISNYATYSNVNNLKQIKIKDFNFNEIIEISSNQGGHRSRKGSTKLKNNEKIETSSNQEEQRSRKGSTKLKNNENEIFSGQEQLSRRDSLKLKNIKFNKLEIINLSSGKYLKPQLLYDLFLSNTNCIKNLALEKVKFNNNNINMLMFFFKKNPILFETLEYLSFSGNNISEINSGIFKTDNSTYILFKKLKIFNLNKNKIYKFDFNSAIFPELKLLDLSNNSILTATLMESNINLKDKLILFNDNIFITNNKNNNIKYINYLNKQLANLDFELKTLHLGFTYDKEKLQYLEQLRLSPGIKISLIKLDLSFCGLTTDALVNFLKNNFGLFSLQSLKLKYNCIDSSLFEKLLSDEILLEKLNIMDLSENEISCNKYEDSVGLVKFIEKYQNLKKIKFINSTFIQNWTRNVAYDLDINGEFKKLYSDFKDKLKKENRNFIFIIEPDNWSYVENEFKHLFFSGENIV